MGGREASEPVNDDSLQALSTAGGQHRFQRLVASGTGMVLLLALFCCLSLSRFDEIHGQDEITHYMTLSRCLFVDWFTHPDRLIVFSPHLYPLCQWGLGVLFGSVNSFTLRLTNLLFWVLLLSLVGWLCRGRRPLGGMVLCALVPVSVGATTIIDIDQGILPFFTLLLVYSVVQWSEGGGCVWRSCFVALSFGLCLWCRPTTPLVLVPLFLCYGWLRHGRRGLVCLLASLVAGFGLFHFSWRLYGELTGVDWVGAYRYLWSSFGSVTTGERASGAGRLAVSLMETVFWGLSPGFVLLAAYGGYDLLWRRFRGGSELPSWSLYLLSGGWLLCGYCVAGGSLFGFPKYQCSGYSLLFLGLWLYGCQRWQWAAFRWRSPWLVALLVLSVALSVWVLGDPQFAFRLTLRESIMTGGGIWPVACSLVCRLVLCHGSLLLAVLLLWKYGHQAVPRLLLVIGLGVNVGLLCRQTLSDYQCGYMYGDRGETRAVAAWMTEHGIDPARSLVPAEVLEALGRDDLSCQSAFMLHDLAAVKGAIESDGPEVVAISWLCYPVGEVQAFLGDEEMRALLSGYEKHCMGHFWLWRLRGAGI